MRCASIPAAILLIAVGSCTEAPAPRPASPVSVARPAPLPPSPPPPAPASADWRDWPATAGDWRYSGGRGESRATFAVAGARVFGVSCGADRRVRLERAAANSGAMTIRTSSLSRALPADGAGATLVASDPIFDAIAFSRGRFVIEQAGLPTLVLPAWADIARVIEDCRG